MSVVNDEIPSSNSSPNVTGQRAEQLKLTESRRKDQGVLGEFTANRSFESRHEPSHNMKLCAIQQSD